jgi:hypothetical protein
MKITMQRLLSRLRAWVLGKLDLVDGVRLRSAIRSNDQLRGDLQSALERIRHLYEELDKAYGLNSLPADYFSADMLRLDNMLQPADLVVLRVRPKQAAINIAGPQGHEMLRRDGAFADLYAMRLADCFGYPAYCQIMQQLGHNPMREADYKARPRRSW